MSTKGSAGKLLDIYGKIRGMTLRQRELLLTNEPMENFPAAKFQRFVTAKRELIEKAAKIQNDLDPEILITIEQERSKLMEELHALELENITLLKNRIGEMGPALQAFTNSGRLRNVYSRTRNPEEPKFIDKKRV